MDYFGASFVAFILAIAELITIGWIYGVDRLCKDIEFMLGIQTGIYWRICWGFITPVLMIVILIYTLIELEPLTYRDYVYPDSAYGKIYGQPIIIDNIHYHISLFVVFGWCLSAFGILQLPLWGIYAVYRRRNEGESILKRILVSFKPTSDWGPIDPILNEKYKQFRLEEESILQNNIGFFGRIKVNVFGR